MRSLFGLIFALAYLLTTHMESYSQESPTPSDTAMKVRVALELAKSDPISPPTDTATAAEKVRVALALAAPVDPKKPVINKREQCHTDYTTAVAKSKTEGRALVLWIGMQCEDNPIAREVLNDCVHCHIDGTDAGEPRIEIPDSPTSRYVIKKSQLATYPKELLRSLANKAVAVKGGANGDCANGFCVDGKCVTGKCESGCPGGNCLVQPASAVPFQSYQQAQPRIRYAAPFQIQSSGGGCAGGNCPR